jgi:hypothetical protein
MCRFILRAYVSWRRLVEYPGTDGSEEYCLHIEEGYVLFRNACIYIKSTSYRNSEDNTMNNERLGRLRPHSRDLLYSGVKGDMR